jgi:phospholipid/cholesterol/gamma-HCH transport system substrate-binding protein|tara:strand:- start:1884 stop:2369 length:486 start_codon:yes stop_codon:yes gene_type:complete
MRRNIIETVMGAVVLIVAIGFVAFALSTSGYRATSGYLLTADFDDASGIVTGSDVYMSGLKIGTVVKQNLDPESYRARLSLSIRPDIKLPEDSTARILSQSLLGGNSIVLSPGGSDVMLAEGDSIEYTQSAINLVDLLGRFIFTGSGSNDGGGAQNSDSGS